MAKYRCPVCGAMFDSREDHDKHHMEEHPEDERGAEEIEEGEDDEEGEEEKE